MVRTRNVLLLIAILAIGWSAEEPTISAANAATPAASLCAVVAVAGVAGTPSSDAAVLMGSPEPELGTVEIEFDLLFLDLMIEHHESAVVMSQVALERAEHEEIRQLAVAIISAQTDEIAQLRIWRAEWYPGAEVHSLDQMNAQMSDVMAGMMDMDGMVQSGEMAEMTGATALSTLCLVPEPFDLAFLDAMLPHHQSAIAMANVALENAERQELKSLALTIVDSQQAEFDEMRSLRTSWYGQ